MLFVTVTYQSSQHQASARTIAGTLKIIAIRGKVTVAAGQFDTARDLRTSQSTDEDWRSLDHGVVSEAHGDGLRGSGPEWTPFDSMEPAVGLEPTTC